MKPPARPPIPVPPPVFESCRHPYLGTACMVPNCRRWRLAENAFLCTMGLVVVLVVVAGAVEMFIRLVVLG